LTEQNTPETYARKRKAEALDEHSIVQSEKRLKHEHQLRVVWEARELDEYMENKRVKICGREKQGEAKRTRFYTIGTFKSKRDGKFKIFEVYQHRV
jgi:hypothetical protein